MHLTFTMIGIQVMWQAIVCSFLGAFGLYLNLNFGLTLSSTSHQFMGITLSFLLVYRSTLAVQRWWKGRTALSMLMHALTCHAGHVNSVLTVRQRLNDTTTKADSFVASLVVHQLRLIIVFSYFLVMHLRGFTKTALPATSRLNYYLTDTERQLLSGPWSVRPGKQCPLRKKGCTVHPCDLTFSRSANTVVYGMAPWSTLPAKGCA